MKRDTASNSSANDSDQAEMGPWAPAEAPVPRSPAGGHEPGLAPSPLLGAGGAREAGGELFQGLYDAGPQKEAPKPNLLPRPSIVKPAYVDEPVAPATPEPLTGIADPRLKAIKDLATRDIGIPGLVETTPGQLVGGAAAAVYGNSQKGPGQRGDPAREAPPVSAPRLTEGERAAEVAKRDAAKKEAAAAKQREEARAAAKKGEAKKENATQDPTKAKEQPDENDVP